MYKNIPKSYFVFIINKYHTLLLITIWKCHILERLLKIDVIYKEFGMIFDLKYLNKRLPLYKKGGSLETIQSYNERY